MGHHLSIIAEDHKKMFALLDKRRKRFHHLPQDNAHINLHRPRDESPARRLKHLDEAIEDADRIAASDADLIDKLTLFCGERSSCLWFLQKFRVPLNAGEGCPELMGQNSKHRPAL